MSHKIFGIPALRDNYIWMIVHSITKQVAVIDPGEAQPVLEMLQQSQFTLRAILVTHHHADHTAGIAGILHQIKAPVYASLEDRVACDFPLVDGDRITLADMELDLQVMAIPGHTLGHVAYVGHGWVFTGDTLFTGGCGRLFEGTADQLFHSLSRLANLPDETLVYCGHEYTVSNLTFATAVEPHNALLQKRWVEAKAARSQGIATVPATIGLEKHTNPFLRCHLPEIQGVVEAACQCALPNALAVFSALRQWKDRFTI